MATNTPATNPDTNKNGVLDRRASSRRRESDVVASGYPRVTKAAYKALIQGTDDTVKLEVKRLCRLHALLGEFLVVCSGAVTNYNPQTPANKGREEQVRPVHNALRSIYDKVELLRRKVPVRVED